VFEYGLTSNFTGATSISISESDLVNGKYTITSGLTAETKHYARIKADCGGGEESNWSDVCEFTPTNAVTACEDFEGVTGTNYNTEGSMPEGWYSYTTATGSNIVKPHVCSGSNYNYYHSSSQSLVFESGTNANGNAAYAVMPANTSGNDYVSLTFYTRVENTSYGTLQVGYVTAQTEAACNNFTPLASGTITSSTTLHQETIDVSSVPSDAFIAFKWQSTSGTYYACGVDDVCLTTLPNPTPKPLNLQVSNITSSGATVSWQAPASVTPTSYQYRLHNDINWTGWESTTDLSVDLTLSASTPYTVQVKAIYSGVGESASVETNFTTLDNCAYPTNLTPYTVAGQGTTATLSWVKGYDETAWVLEYATDELFTVGLQTVTDGFTVDGNNVTCNLNGLTAEQTYYARVKADCDGPTSSWSNVVSFTPTNFIDYTYNNGATSSTSYHPFYGYYANSATNHSQFVIPAAELTEIAGSTIRSITYYTSSTVTTDWGGVKFDVYMAEVENSTFSTATFIDWDNLTNVYTGTVSLSNGQMTIAFDQNYTYNGGNLLIGFKTNAAGTIQQSISWTAVYRSGEYNIVYQTGSTPSRTTYFPKITFSQRPSPYYKPVIDEANCYYAFTSAHIAWTVTGATPTGYQYQYKQASDAEWPTLWSSTTNTYADIPSLTSATTYNFRVKALYDGGHESVVVNYQFNTACEPITTFPKTYNFETTEGFPANASTPTTNQLGACWRNEATVQSGYNATRVWGTSTTYSHKDSQSLVLPDKGNNTNFAKTMLVFPPMEFTSAHGYTVSFWIYRNGTASDGEGFKVYASDCDTIGPNAVELGHYSRNYAQPYPVQESASGWYQYETNPIMLTGTVYLIFEGQSYYHSDTYVDEVTIDAVPTCPKPTDLIVGTAGNHYVQLSWTMGSDETAWDICLNGDEDHLTNIDTDTPGVAVSGSTVTYTLTGLAALTPYTVKVRANCGAEDGVSVWSNEESFTTDVACPVPTNVVASNVTNNSAEISWEGDAANYKLRYRGLETPTTATVILTVDGDIWSDGSGYQMVLDADANMYGNVYDNVNDVYLITDYSDFEYLIPNDATFDPDGSVVFDASASITIPAGTYDWYIFNPSPGDNVYQASGNGNVGGSQDNYVFEAGKTYEFVVSYYSGNDQVNVTITNSTPAATGDWIVVNDATSPQPISPLTDEQMYEVQVQAVCGGIDGESDWTTSITFTTLSNCAAPAELNAAVTASSATLSWSGAQATYNVKYAKLVPGEVVATTEDFEGQTPAGYSASGELPAGWKSYTTGSYAPHVSDASSYGDYITALTDNYLLMTTNAYNESAYAIMPQYDNISAVSFNYAFESASACGNLEVGYVTDNTGYSTFSRLQEIEPEDGDVSYSYTLTAADIATINNNKGYIAFKYNSNSGTYYSVALDDVAVSYQALTPGAWVNRTEVTSPLLIENLDNNSKYMWQVQGINASCGTDGVTDWSAMANFTTPYPTFTRVITGYGTNDGGYVLVASPLAGETNPTDVENMIDAEGNYDLYYFDQAQDLEWINYKDSENGGGYKLVNGKGYLYANKNTVTLTITGAPYSGNGEIDLTYSASAVEFPGYNLIGNPFGTPATLDRPFYKMNETGDGFTAKIEDPTNTIAVMEGVFVEATTSDNKATFTAQEASKGGQAIAQTNIVVSGNKGQVLDNAVIRFDGGKQLGKFSFRQGSTKVFITEEGKDYAVVNAGHVGEIPVSFKTEKNGTYSMNFTSQEVSFSYLHLIDNMTGDDVNLLETPSYSFDAQTTDYANRFRLVFATGSSADSDSFSFINAMGNLCIFGIEGEATVQVIDVLGHVLSSDTFSGSYEKSINAAPGVYMIRLIQGNDVKVQKIVVR
jgi:hypothetical protein